MPRETKSDEIGMGLHEAFLTSLEQVALGMLSGSTLSAGGASIRTEGGDSYFVMVMGGDRARVEELAFKMRDMVEAARKPNEKAQSATKDRRGEMK